MLQRLTTRGFTNGVCNGCGRPRGQHISSEKSLMRPQPEIGKSRGATTADEDWAVPCAANETTGWIPRCSHPADDPVPCLILDPFGGSGTTAYVARSLGRRSILIELNPAYVALARRRSGADTRSLEAFAGAD
ncbi:MAG: DNA methyltransferase [Thermoplasmata archaeon]